MTEAGTEEETMVDDLGEDLVAYFAQLDEEQVRAEMVGGGSEERFELGLQPLVGGLDKYVMK